MLHFDAKKFLKESFGTEDNLRNRLVEHGFEPPNSEALRKWGQRNQIPAAWLPRLLYVLAKDTNQLAGILPYMIRSESTCRTVHKKRDFSGTRPSVFE